MFLKSDINKNQILGLLPFPCICLLLILLCLRTITLKKNTALHILTTGRQKENIDLVIYSASGWCISKYLPTKTFSRQECSVNVCFMDMLQRQPLYSLHWCLIHYLCLMGVGLHWHAWYLTSPLFRLRLFDYCCIYSWESNRKFEGRERGSSLGWSQDDAVMRYCMTLKQVYFFTTCTGAVAVSSFRFSSGRGIKSKYS